MYPACGPIAATGFIELNYRLLTGCHLIIHMHLVHLVAGPGQFIYKLINFNWSYDRASRGDIIVLQ